TAIKAHGGRDALSRMAQMVRKDTGVIIIAGKEVPISDELVLALPDRLRLTVEIGPDARRPRVINVLNGDKGWRDSGAKTTDLDQEQLSPLREDAQILWVASLVPLLKDNAYELAPVPEEKVNNQPAAGVKVTRKGFPDLKLYFDKKSSML